VNVENMDSPSFPEHEEMGSFLHSSPLKEMHDRRFVAEPSTEQVIVPEASVEHVKEVVPEASVEHVKELSEQF
jgi:hypothetical protein